jgi:hypothetical protein
MNRLCWLARQIRGLVSPRQAQQFCSTENQHTPVHSVAAVVLRGAIKETCCINTRGIRWRSWLRHCGHRRFAGSVPVGVTGNFHDNPSGCIMALGSTQPLGNEYQEYLLGGKGGRGVGLTTFPPLCIECLEIGEFQPPGTLRACNRPVQGLLYPLLINIQGLGLKKYSITAE